MAIPLQQKKLSGAFFVVRVKSYIKAYGFCKRIREKQINKL